MKNIILVCVLLAYSLANAQPNPPVLTMGVSGSGTSGASQNLASAYYQNGTQNCSANVEATCEVQGIVQYVRLHVSDDEGLGSYSFSTTNGLTNTILNVSADLNQPSGSLIPGTNITVYHATYTSPYFKTVKFVIPVDGVTIKRGQTYVYSARCATPTSSGSDFATQKYFGVMLCPPVLTDLGNGSLDAQAVSTPSNHPLQTLRLMFSPSSSGFGNYSGFTSNLTATFNLSSGTTLSLGQLQSSIPSLVTGQSYYVTGRWWNGISLGEYTQPVLYTAGSVAPPPPTCNLSVTAQNESDATCNQANGQASAVVNGGTAPYSYSWNNGETSLYATGFPGNNYAKVTVTDGAGCTESSDVWLNYISPSTSNFTVAINSNIATFNNQSSGANVVNWDFGDGSSSTDYSPNHTYNTSGVYTVTLNTDDGSGMCPSTSQQQVVINATPPPSPCSTPVPVNIISSLPSSPQVPLPIFSNSFDSALNVDESGNNGVVTVMGSPNLVPGVHGNCMILRGVNNPDYMTNPDALRIANSSALALSNSMTVSYWVKINGDMMQTFADCSGNIVPGILGTAFAKSGDRNGLYMMEAATSTSANNAPYVLGGPGISTSGIANAFQEWRHVTYVIDGNQSSIYVNGVLASTATVPSMADFTYANQRDLYLGVSYNGQPYTYGGACLDYWGHLDGSIDEFKMFNVALDASQVQALYANNVNTTVCANTSITLEAVSGASAYLWSTGETTASITVSPNTTTTYSVTVTDANACTGSASTTINIATALNPVFTATTNPSNALDVSFTSNLLDTEGSFDFGDGTGLVGNANPVHTFTAYGTYNVVLTSTNSAGCIETYSQTVTLTQPCKYSVSNLQLACYRSVFCLPININAPITPGAIGLDIELDFDASLFTPTGQATLGNVITDSDPNAGYSIYTSNGHLYIAIYYEASASVNAEFTGQGTIACIEFTLNQPLPSGQTTNFVLTSVLESYEASSHFECADNSQGVLTFISDAPVAKVVHAVSGLPLGTTVTQTFATPTDASCQATGAAQIVDNDGLVSLAGATHASFERDIDDNSSVIQDINGADAQAGIQIATTQNAMPSIIELLSADVNGDGRVSSGDATLILRRSVQLIAYYPNSVQDWIFVTDNLLSTTPFTTADRWHVPSVPTCFPLDMTLHGSSCIEAADTSLFKSIMMGDVNSSYQSSSALRTSDVITLDLSKAKQENGMFKVPVYTSTPSNSLSFELALSNSSFMSVESTTNYASNYLNDHVLFSSYSENLIPADSVIAYLVFQNMPSAADFNLLVFSEVNNIPIALTIIDANGVLNTNEVENQNMVSITPNPTNGLLTLSLNTESKNTNLNIYDGLGRLIRNYVFSTKTTEFNISDLPSGTYYLQISTDTQNEIKRIIKN